MKYKGNFANSNCCTVFQTSKHNRDIKSEPIKLDTKKNEGRYLIATRNQQRSIQTTQPFQAPFYHEAHFTNPCTLQSKIYDNVSIINLSSDLYGCNFRIIYSKHINYLQLSTFANIVHTTQNSQNKWNKILSLEMTICGLNMMVKSGLEN